VALVISRGIQPMSSWNAMAKLDPLWTILPDLEKKFGKWAQRNSSVLVIGKRSACYLCARQMELVFPMDGSLTVVAV
jgi:hypothetical protein